MNAKIQSILMMTFLGCMFTFCVATLNKTNTQASLSTEIETISYEDIHNTEIETELEAEIETSANSTVGDPLEATEATTEQIIEIQEEQTTVIETTPVNNNRWGVSLTGSEIDLLARILWHEARGECKEGQIAVVEVVFNRMVKNNTDVTSILSAKNQFESWSKRNTATNYEAQIEIIKEVLRGETNVLDKNVLYFAMWPLGRDVVKVIGCHYFSTDWCKEIAIRKGN